MDKSVDVLFDFLPIIGSIPGQARLIFNVSMANYFFLFDYDFSLQPKLYFICNKFLKILKNDKSKRSIWHRDLKSDSHKHFCNRFLTKQGIILGHGGSKKDCLNSCRNRSSQHRRPSRDSNPHPLREHLLDLKWFMPYNIDLTKIYLNITLKCFIVRSFLAQKILCKFNTFRIKVYSSDKKLVHFTLLNSPV